MCFCMTESVISDLGCQHYIEHVLELSCLDERIDSVIVVREVQVPTNGDFVIQLDLAKLHCSKVMGPALAWQCQ